LKELERFPFKSRIVPGDDRCIVSFGFKQSFRSPGGEDNPIEFGGPGTVIMQFLTDAIVGGVVGREAVVGMADGSILYRVPVTEKWRANLLPSMAGSRFCIHDWDHTRWNKLLNFPDIVEDTRPFNFERIRVLETLTGKQLFEFHWGSRPFGVVKPALSLTGHRVAILRGGFLEVYEFL